MSLTRLLPIRRSFFGDFLSRGVLPLPAVFFSVFGLSSLVSAMFCFRYSCILFIILNCLVFSFSSSFVFFIRAISFRTSWWSSCSAVTCTDTSWRIWWHLKRRSDCCLQRGKGHTPIWASESRPTQSMWNHISQWEHWTISFKFWRPWRHPSGKQYNSVVFILFLVCLFFIFFTWDGWVSGATVTGSCMRVLFVCLDCLLRLVDLG